MILRILTIIVFVFALSCNMTAQKQKTEQKKTNTMQLNKLTKEEKAVIINKGTEIPFTGMYNNHWKSGTYTCKQCDAPLYKSGDKFDGHCGWPSFDDEIAGAVKRIPDADGRRTEIVCTNCGGHLGHVFLGEGFTDKNTRHCVNSVSLNFEPLKLNQTTSAKAYFAGGCFWGMEYFYAKTEGVISTSVGYMGGESSNPTYREVCSGTSGHYEVIEVVYDSTKVSYEELARLFFEIHDPTQTNGQGPDIGEQYLSVAFYSTEREKETLEKLIQLLKSNGYKIATRLEKVKPYWEAENYHQDYYEKNGKQPYCHSYTKRF